MDEKQLIRKHLELVLEANETTNLTRIDTFDEGMLLHVEDSLAGLDEVEQAPPGWEQGVATLAFLSPS